MYDWVYLKNYIAKEFIKIITIKTKQDSKSS